MTKALYVLGYLNARQVVSGDLSLPSFMPRDAYKPENLQPMFLDQEEDIAVTRERLFEDAVAYALRAGLTPRDVGRLVVELGEAIVDAKARKE